MRQDKFIIKENRLVATKVYRMVLEGDTEGIKPGQFVMIELPEKFLRRPISVCDCEDGLLTIIYKVVGEGTARMAAMQEGESLNVITGLGNGYNLTKAGTSALLVGGGVGVPPLYYLARKLRAEGLELRVVLGFNTKDEVFYEEEFKALGCQVTVCTADGSYGMKGFVTAALCEDEPYYYSCGPLPMLKALVKKVGTNGEISMEERMGCGFGICVGCSIETRNGVKRVCKEGPVFGAAELQMISDSRAELEVISD